MITVLISYNKVVNFNSGWHGNKLFVCANDAGAGANTDEGESSGQKARCAMHRISGNFYRGEVPAEEVDRYVIYAGLHAFEGAIRMAKELRQRVPAAQIEVRACACEWSEKLRMLAGTGITLCECECGGSATLGDLARQIFGGVPSDQPVIAG